MPRKPKATLRNLDRILRGDPLFAGQLRWNELKQAIEWRGAVLQDHHVTELRLAVAERHEVASGRYKEVLGHTAVDAETGTASRNVEAVVLHALAAVRTLAAAPCAVNGNGRTNLEPGSWHSAGTECFDPASVLVAEGHWCFARAACRELHEADIAVACAGAANANEHLARAGIGLSDLVECSGGVDLGRTADQLECLHGNPRRQSNV